MWKTVAPPRRLTFLLVGAIAASCVMRRATIGSATLRNAIMLSRFIRAQRTQAMAGIPASTTIGISAPTIMDTMMASIMIGMETMTTSSTIDHAGRQMREAVADLRSRSATEHHGRAGFVLGGPVFSAQSCRTGTIFGCCHIGQFQLAKN